MANITLWYKEALSDTLGNVPVGQKILFDNDQVGVEKYTWPSWNNNIKITSNDNRIGVRTTNMEDAGFSGVDVLLVGNVKNLASQEALNLFAFVKILQTPDNYPQGRFCIDNPNGPLMTIEAANKDATNVHGLSIVKPSIVWNPTNGSYDFNLPFVHGGKIT